jgi:hypothetical protein
MTSCIVRSYEPADEPAVFALIASTLTSFGFPEGTLPVIMMCFEVTTYLFADKMRAMLTSNLCHFSLCCNLHASGGLRADLATVTSTYVAPYAGFWVAVDVDTGTVAGSVAIRPYMRNAPTAVNVVASEVQSEGNTSIASGHHDFESDHHVFCCAHASLTLTHLIHVYLANTISLNVWKVASVERFRFRVDLRTGRRSLSQCL